MVLSPMYILYMRVPMRDIPLCQDGESPLLIAVGCEKIDTVEELLNANADPNLRTVCRYKNVKMCQ